MRTIQDTLIREPSGSPGAISAEPAAFREAFPYAFSEPSSPLSKGPTVEGDLRPASAEAVFGPLSQIQAVVSVAEPRQKVDPQRVNNLLLDGLAILLFVHAFFLLHRYRSSIGVLFRALTVKGQFDQLIDEQGVAFRQFVENARAMGFLALLTVLFKGCLVWNAAAPTLQIPGEYLPFLLPLLIGALAAIGCYKWVVTGTIAVLSADAGRIGHFRTFDRLCFATAALLFTPLVLLLALADPADGNAFFVIGAILLILFLLYYFVKNFSFFISRKASILQWILYLCAVEIFPVSFFVLFVRRGFEG